MKSKSVWVLLVVFAALLAVVLFLKPKVSEETELKLVDLNAADVRRVSLTRGTEVLAFAKDDNGEWAVTSPLAAPADAFEVSRLAEDFAGLKVEKVVESKTDDPSRFGIPRTEVSLWFKGSEEPVTVLVGEENPLDKTLYAQKKGDPRIVLLPAYLKSTLDKTLLDFRQKDVFRFETADAGTLRVKSKTIDWEASLREGDWFLDRPMKALAQKTQVTALLNTLSGLRAKAFAAEQKTEADMKAFGLDAPDVTASVSLPKSNQTLVYLVRKLKDKVYVTTAASNKIVEAEDQLLTDLDKKPDALREKRAAVFSAWQADRLDVRKGELRLSFSKEKDGSWTFRSGGAGPADESKVETFIRLVGNLEASEFIDAPGPPSSFGLDKPAAEVKVRVSPDDGPARETTLLVGTEDKAAGLVILRNPQFPYLFRVSSSFLADFPAAAADWKKTEAKDRTE